MYRIRKLIAVLCALCLVAACLAGCSQTQSTATTTTTDTEGNGFMIENAETATESPEPKYPTLNTGVITGMGLDENGNFSISREPAKSVPMGEKDSWTIFVYLCGSNLESDWGLGTGDLQEMIDGSEGTKARYIVMTGGSLEWQNTLVDESALEIYLVEDGDINLIRSLDYGYMNDYNTLYDFLSWGIENYPADKMGVVFWDHGGGCIDGVCVDEWFYNDMNSGKLENSSDYDSTLTLPKISRVLSKVSEQMTDKFEFVGYDACLMGTLENAFMLSSYARYMYASEELEPGYGWDYTAIGEAIGASGNINGSKLGKVVCDSFYESCAAVEQEENSTFACINLSAIDDVILSFDAFARNLMDAAEDPATLAAIIQNTSRVEFFGGNSESEGYYNLADMAGVVSALSPIIPGAKTVLNSINQAVTYNRNGIFHEKACGMSLYYPLHAEPGTGTLGNFAEVVTGPYYYGYVAKNFYAAANGGLKGYDPAVSLSAWATAVDDSIENVVEEYGGAHVTGQSPYVKFVEKPRMYAEGYYGFTLEQESIPYISSVEANLYFLSDDEADLVCIGSTTDVIADWETGEFRDNFDGMWFCFPDGQLISTTVVSETEDYSTYTTPVLLNGVETNLRFVVNDRDYSAKLYGVWNSVDEYGMAGKNTYELTAGDVLQPLFKAVKQETGEEVLYYGEEYVYDGDDSIYYAYLFDDDYYYQFCIYDIYGDNYTSDGVFFNVKDSQPYFYPDE